MSNLSKPLKRMAALTLSLICILIAFFNLLFLIAGMLGTAPLVAFAILLEYIIYGDADYFSDLYGDTLRSWGGVTNKFGDFPESLLRWANE